MRKLYVISLMLLTNLSFSQKLVPEVNRYAEGRKPIPQYMDCDIEVSFQDIKTKKQVAVVESGINGVDILFSKSKRKKQFTVLSFSYVAKNDVSELFENLKLHIYLLRSKKTKLFFLIKDYNGKVIHKDKFLYRKSNEISHNVPYYLTDDEFYIETKKVMKKEKNYQVEYYLDCRKRTYHPNLKSWPYYN